MKKILLITLLIIMIPYLVVNFFVKTDEIKFYYMNNKIIRVKDIDKDEIINKKMVREL